MTSPHPDFAQTPLPRSFRLGDFAFAPLGPDCVDEDFEAVTSSEALLVTLSGHWPIGLTLEENRADLYWHMREFDFARSFAWVVRSPDGTYLGCAYVYPDPGARGSGRVVLWLRKSLATASRMADFRQKFTAFMADHGLSEAAYPIRTPDTAAA